MHNNPETKDSLSKCMKSMIDKSGKLRQLLRDINQNYSNDSAAKQSLEKQLNKWKYLLDQINVHKQHLWNHAIYVYNYIFHIPIEDLRDYPIRDHQDWCGVRFFEWGVDWRRSLRLGDG